MKLIVSIAAYCIFSMCYGQDCKCEYGFIPRTNNDAEIQCYGLLKKIIQPCGMLGDTPCNCTSASGVVYDNEGRWCANFSNGEQTKKWHCENEQ